MILEKSDASTIKNFAQIALDNQLYVEGWGLKRALQKVLKSSDNKLENSFIILGKTKSDNEIVGVSTFLKHEYCNLQTFIKNEYRGKKYGSLLIQEVIRSVPDNLKKDIKIVEGDFCSFLLFRNLFLKGVISESNFIENQTLTKIDVLNTYLFCIEKSLDINKYVPSWKNLFYLEERTFLENSIEKGYIKI